jgi:hypothetical protein
MNRDPKSQTSTPKGRQHGDGITGALYFDTRFTCVRWEKLIPEAAPCKTHGSLSTPPSSHSTGGLDLPVKGMPGQWKAVGKVADLTVLRPGPWGCRQEPQVIASKKLPSSQISSEHPASNAHDSATANPLIGGERSSRQRPENNMASKKNKATSTSHRKFKDLQSKGNPKGGGDIFLLAPSGSTQGQIKGSVKKSGSSSTSENSINDTLEREFLQNLNKII